MPQQVKAWIIEFRLRNAEHLLAELCPQRPLIEHEPDIKSTCQRVFNFLDFQWPKSMADEAGVIDAGCISKRTVADRKRDDFLNCSAAIS